MMSNAVERSMRMETDRMVWGRIVRKVFVQHARKEVEDLSLADLRADLVGL
jgi:hypothetical protein